MEINYYGIEGAEMEPEFYSPDFFVDLLVKGQEVILNYGTIKIPTTDIDYVEPTIYENGVVYNFTHSSYPPGITKYDRRTEGCIVVGPEGASFVVTSVDPSFNKDTEVQNRESDNRRISYGLKRSLGKEISMEGAFTSRKPEPTNNPVKKLLNKRRWEEAEREREIKRKIFKDKVSKSMTVLEQVRESLEKNKTNSSR